MTNSDVGDQIPTPATPATPATVSTRRGLLGAGVAGVTLAALAARSAGATGPSPADRELLDFAMQLELAARDLYRAAVDAGADPTIAAVMAEQHESYAQALAGFAGLSARLANGDVVDQYESSFATSDTDAVLEAAYELESIAVATHTELLGMLEGAGAARLVASILAIEARHCAVLADATGRGDDLDALLVNTAEPLLPEDLS